jgi:hypothetical protein
MSWNFSTARDDRPAMRSPTKSHNRPNRQLAALAVGFLAMLFLAQPAAAHGGEVAIDVVPAVSGTTVTFNVHLTFEEDGHNVAGQTVDVSAVGPTGTKTAQLPASDAEGRTSGAIDLDAGSWSVTFTTEEGTATVEQVVDGVGDTAASSTTAAPGDATTSTAPAADDTTTDDTTTSTIVVPVATSGEGVGGAADDDDSSALVPILIGVLVVGAIGAGVVFSRRRGGGSAGRVPID